MGLPLWKNRFFDPEYHKKKFSWPILPNKKRLEKWPFLDFLNFFFL